MYCLPCFLGRDERKPESLHARVGGVQDTLATVMARESFPVPV